MHSYAEPEQAQKQDATNKYSHNRPVQRRTAGNFATEPHSGVMKPLQAKLDFSQAHQPVQRFAGASDANNGAVPPNRPVTVNKTGMPDRLKAGIESLSGLDMSKSQRGQTRLIF